MRIIFFGTGHFGMPTIKSLIGNAGHETIAVVTQPDRRQGRGWNVLPTPVKAFVEKAAPGMPILQPEKASDKDFIGNIRSLAADVFVVIDYGQILKKELLDIPTKGCINLHPSLLPRYRGAAPVNWAIINGERETGNTVFLMDERMDAGDIILQRGTKIRDGEDAIGLLERLSWEGVDMVLQALDTVSKGPGQFLKQGEEAATYAPKLDKGMGRIDWNTDARNIVDRVRGLQPWPAAYTFLGGRMLKILSAVISDMYAEDIPPGGIIDEKRLIVMACNGSVELKHVQLQGKRGMTAVDFMRGFRLSKGVVLGE